MKATARVSIRLPAELVARLKTEADRCGLTVRQLVSEAADSVLAERCCVHQAPADADPEAEDPGR